MCEYLLIHYISYEKNRQFYHQTRDKFVLHFINFICILVNQKAVEL